MPLRSSRWTDEFCVPHVSSGDGMARREPQIFTRSACIIQTGWTPFGFGMPFLPRSIREALPSPAEPMQHLSRVAAACHGRKGPDTPERSGFSPREVVVYRLSRRKHAQTGLERIRQQMRKLPQRSLRRSVLCVVEESRQLPVNNSTRSGPGRGLDRRAEVRAGAEGTRSAISGVPQPAIGSTTLEGIGRPKERRCYNEMRDPRTVPPTRSCLPAAKAVNARS